MIFNSSAIIDATINDTTIFPANSTIGNRLINYDFSLLSGLNRMPNPSFETYTICPTTGFGLTSSFTDHGVLGWESPTYGLGGMINGTSDYFNACDATNSVGVPINVSGSQLARTGNAYAGIGYWWDANSEYLQIQLLTPLLVGVEYAVNMFVSVGDLGSDGARNGLGIYLGATKFIPPHSGILPLTPQIIDTNIILDRVDWYPIGGAFIAAGGEEWLMIGNYLDNSVAKVKNGQQIYYYVDDVSLASLSEIVSCLTPLPVDFISFTAEFHSNFRSFWCSTGY